MGCVRARVGWVRLALLYLALAGLGWSATAQTLQSPILTIESDRLFADSLFGRRMAREIDTASAVLATENRRIEAELTAEEQALTERRADMPPEEFRALADAFDQKVEEIRRTQDNTARRLSQQNDASRVQFLRAARPVMEQLMRETGAAVVLERSSVFLSANATDVTDELITRIDAAIGDGSAVEDSPPTDDDPDLP
ncbi:MAG: OmpH family outer membrane protein [Pseudomonadota bacterium]